jgi:hypothetical protein
MRNEMKEKPLFIHPCGIHHFSRVRLGGESGEGFFFGLAAVMRFELTSSRLQDERSRVSN